MAEVYNHKVVEKKWQKVWDDEKAFAATNDYSKPKYYALVEFPYPSGQGLHVGHPRPYTALDIVARKRRMQGYNVLYPMGWDAFGLPTENYAIKNKIHPKIVTENNVKHFKDQLHSLGYSFDWDREINTTDPKYYKWTQWIFLKLFKAGLAYKKEMPINWCTSCKVGLANEEVVNGVCERCGAPVVRKVKSEWMLKITDYADKLIEGLNDVDYIERVKVSQKNWIGRSTGAEVDFQIKDTEDKLRIYTTRCDTLFGVTYMVVCAAPGGCPHGKGGGRTMSCQGAVSPKGARKLHDADVVYLYDGSFEGFLCCVYESFAQHELPFAVWTPQRETATLYPVKEIATDPAIARRVFASFGKKLGAETEYLVSRDFLSGREDKELLLIRFLHLAFALGPGTVKRTGHPDVAPLYEMKKSLDWEVDKFQGFVRFEEHDGMLGAVIHPKNYILPLLRPHFCGRFPEENFMIYDAVHQAVLLQEDHKARLLELAAPLELPPPSEREQQFQALWKQFYQTLEIKARHNEKGRMTHCPKRFWADMVEMKDEF